MGNNSFAQFSSNPLSFVVQNISLKPKTIFIFQAPIPYGKTRNLMLLPGISEESVRASLLKGTLNHKIKAQEIVILSSDIDLTQYNLTNKTFLQSAGVVNGLGPSGGGGITVEEHETLRQLIHFINDGPADGFPSGAYKEISPITPFPASETWYIDVSKSQKIVEKLLTYNLNNFPVMITWNVYNENGITIAHSITDTITYDGAFETTRTRSIF